MYPFKYFGRTSWTGVQSKVSTHTGQHNTEKPVRNIHAPSVIRNRDTSVRAVRDHMRLRQMATGTGSHKVIY
jgi:hypothetical protein